PVYRKCFRNSLVDLLQANAGLGDQAGAKQAAEKLRDLGFDPPDNAFDAACALAHCIEIIQQDQTATKEARAKQTAFYGDEAMKMLHDAARKGWLNAAQLKSGKALDPLREREDFKELLAELEAKNKESGLGNQESEKKSRSD